MSAFMCAVAVSYSKLTQTMILRNTLSRANEHSGKTPLPRGRAATFALNSSPDRQLNI